MEKEQPIRWYICEYVCNGCGDSCRLTANGRIEKSKSKVSIFNTPIRCPWLLPNCRWKEVE